MNIKGQKKILAVLVACLGLSAVPGAASAALIDGAIGFGGIFAGTNNGMYTTLPNATGIDILGSTVIAANGDFTPAVGSAATFAPIMFDPANTPITPLWTVTAGAVTYSFDLDDISVDFRSDDQIDLSGSGTLMATGFDDTAGTWTFSGDQAGIILFSFTSITAANDVPEPTSLILMGAGLLGFAAARRRRLGK